MGKDLKELSRLNYNPEPEGRVMNDTEIQTGCLQRIANAVEKMTTKHDEAIAENKRLQDRIKQLETDKDQYRRWWKEKEETVASLRRQISGLRGYQKRLQNQAKNLENELQLIKQNNIH